MGAAQASGGLWAECWAEGPSSLKHYSRRWDQCLPGKNLGEGAATQPLGQHLAALSLPLTPPLVPGLWSLPSGRKQVEVTPFTSSLSWSCRKWPSRSTPAHPPYASLPTAASCTLGGGHLAPLPCAWEEVRTLGCPPRLPEDSVCTSLLPHQRWEGSGRRRSAFQPFGGRGQLGLGKPPCGSLGPRVRPGRRRPLS